MKTRRVMLMIEIETDVPLRQLRKKGAIDVTCVDRGFPRYVGKVHQVQANVIRADRKETKE